MWSEYPVRLFAVKVFEASHGLTWGHAKCCLHYLKGNKEPYFSVTNRNGCAHETILKQFPQLKPIVELHLCGMSGVPMHAAENGFYHYAEGVDEHGKRVYHESEEARKAEQVRRDQEAFERLRNAITYRITYGELQDIWNHVDIYGRMAYYSDLFKTAWRIKLEIKSTLLELVQARNNDILANHLRIPLEDAEAIPAGLTKQEFEDRYVTPNLERWKKEAEEAIAWMEEHRSDTVPSSVKAGDVYYFSEVAYEEWKQSAKLVLDRSDPCLVDTLSPMR